MTDNPNLIESGGDYKGYLIADLRSGNVGQP